MRIASLKAPGFKGRDIDQKYDAANLIVADSFTGKTAESQAIQIMLYGYLPSLSKENSSTFSLCSDPKEMFVRGSFDSGQVNQLVLSKDEKGGISRTLDLAVKVPLTLLDAKEYLKLTGQKQLAYVLERVNLKKAGYDESQLIKDLLALPSRTDALKKWDRELRESIAQRDRTQSSVCLWMESFLPRLKKAKKTASDTIDAHESVIANLEKAEQPEDVTSARATAKTALLEAMQALTVIDAKFQRKGIDQQLANERANESRIKSQIGDMEAEQIKMRKLKHCPVCLAETKGWLDRWQTMQDAKSDELSAALSKSQQASRGFQKQLDDLESAIKSDRARAKAIKAQEAAQQQVNELDDKNALWLAYNAGREQLKQKREAIIEQKDELAVIKHMADRLVKYQSDLVEKAFGSLLKTARLFTDGILNSPLEYRDGELGRRASELDKKRGSQIKIGHWIPMNDDNFSGTEQLLAYAGLQVALSAESPIKLVIMDEMGRMPAVRKKQVMQRMLELIKSGDIDQFIGIDVESDSYPKSGFKLIKL